jgi:hypothetical protein
MFSLDLAAYKQPLSRIPPLQVLSSLFGEGVCGRCTSRPHSRPGLILRFAENRPCPPGANAGHISTCGAFVAACGRSIVAVGGAGSRSVTALSAVIGTLGMASSSVFLTEPADVPK